MKQDNERLVKNLEERVAELDREKSKMAALADNMLEGAVLLDSKGELLFVNLKAKIIVGFDYANQGKIVEGLLDKFSQYDIQDRINKCIAGTPSRIENAEVADRIFKIHFSCLPLPDQNGFWGHIIWLQDMTEERMLERTRNEFFTLASHELRTPLTQIAWNVSIILKFFAKQLNPEVMGMIKEIQEAAMRLVRIVNDFLTVSKIEQNKVLFRTNKTDLVLLISNTIQDMKYMADAKNIYLEFKTPSQDPPRVLADEERVREILSNLLSNAINYTSQGGVSVEIKTSDRFLEVFVTDTGAGIPAHTQKYLFRKFQQAEENIYTREVTQGTGLGLYISKSFAENMGGTLRLVKSEIGKGSVFSFSLPIAADSPV